MKVRAHAFVGGMVKVFSSQSEIRHEASSRNVTGWVLNLPDGRGEAGFEEKGTMWGARVNHMKHF